VPHHPGRYAFTCDVGEEGSIQTLLHSVRQRFKNQPLHALLHAVAYASPDAMRGPFLRTSKGDFLEAHALSSYSLVALAREAFPLMARRRGGGLGEGGEGGGLPVPPPPPPLVEGVGGSVGEGVGGEGGSIVSLSYLGSSRVRRLIP
jgi:enoyl-[acyl-carrier-protein] reductase (NADH)